MGSQTILNPIQREFLGLIIKEPYILKHYYWTGGTALAEFYLRHRESEDIDLFSENEVNVGAISNFVGAMAKKIEATDITSQRFLGLYSFTFHLPKTSLKVDFNYYPFLRIDQKKKWQGLAVDSLEDIAVNKVHTMFMKPRARDFVDLYFILKKEYEFSLERLINLADAKFDWHIEPVQLGENFAKVVAIKDFPKMLVPFDKKAMEKFFLNLAKSLKPQIFQ
ncbi:MAG: nucleotidyl transferase AbiEii/AbiGii toxin family protein [Patescibacteria group bacterium]|nr:nucleotidyl transferase AbiEii/AbiGii toxin family protein [Patescibacteria group bacterium]MCL5432254.1 nucleotidyl transferase AbiEii/AbiGii toxin family protein [Patescibacteria group bacterium]